MFYIKKIKKKVIKKRFKKKKNNKKKLQEAGGKRENLNITNFNNYKLIIAIIFN